MDKIIGEHVSTQALQDMETGVETAIEDLEKPQAPTSGDGAMLGALVAAAVPKVEIAATVASSFIGAPSAKPAQEGSFFGSHPKGGKAQHKSASIFVPGSGAESYSEKVKMAKAQPVAAAPKKNTTGLFESLKVTAMSVGKKAFQPKGVKATAATAAGLIGAAPSEMKIILGEIRRRLQNPDVNVLKEDINKGVQVAVTKIQRIKPQLPHGSGTTQA